MMMYALRMCLAFLLTAAVAMVFILLVFLRPFHRNNMALGCFMVAHTCKWVWGVRFEIENEHLLSPDRPTVFIGNHQDTQDIFFVPAVIRKGVVTLGKWELLYIPIIGWAYWFSGNIPIKRERKIRAQAALKRVAKKLNHNNMSVLIFPEGTRNWGEPLPFKLGAFKLAIEAQAPIVPICFSLRHLTLDYRKWHAGTVFIRVLPPIETKGLTQQDAVPLAKSCRRLIEEECKLISQAR